MFNKFLGAGCLMQIFAVFLNLAFWGGLVYIVLWLLNHFGVI